MANSPLFAEDTKFSIFKKLWASISVDYFWDAKVGDECGSGINDLISVTGLSCVMKIWVATELASSDQVVVALLLTNVHVEMLERVLAWFMCEDQLCLIGILVCFTRQAGFGMTTRVNFWLLPSSFQSFGAWSGVFEGMS